MNRGEKMNCRNLFMCCILVLSILTACGNPAKTMDTTHGTEPVPASGDIDEMKKDSQPAEPKAEIKDKGQLIKVYYTDSQALELIEDEHELTINRDQSIYQVAFQALTRPSNPQSIPLWKENQVVHLDFADGELLIDLRSSGPKYGSSVERLMIVSLLETMFQFPEVERIKLTVNGQIEESLYGHMQINQIFTKDMLADL